MILKSHVVFKENLVLFTQHLCSRLVLSFTYSILFTLHHLLVKEHNYYSHFRDKGVESEKKD